MKKIVFIFCFIILSCNNNDDTDCSTVLPPPNYFQISFEDIDGNSLIGNVYVQDSFKLRTVNTIQYLKPQQDRLLIRYEEIISNETYFLELNEADTDTLIVKYSHIQTDCFINFILETFTYNQDILYDSQLTEILDLIVITKN
jgi:hypothetical protein